MVPRAGREPENRLRATATTLENEHLRLEIDPANGRIARLVLREGGKDVANLLRPGRSRAAVVDDTSDTWGHRRLAYRDEVGEFEAMGVELVESGPVRGILRVISTYGDSTLNEDFVLSAGASMVEVRSILNWREKAKLLKLRFPTLLRATSATYEIPYGALERPADGEEEPGQRWIDVSGRLRGRDGTFGLGVLNDGKYGFDIRDGELGVTAVRSPIFAHHEPTSPASGTRYQFQDQGAQRFTLGLVPHRGSWPDANLTRQAIELNQRPTILLESAHGGPLPAMTSFAEVAPDHVVLGALKLAEDGTDLVVRLVETCGRAAIASVTFPAWEHRVEVEIGPFQIRTFRITGDGAAIETDLLERPLGGTDAAPTARSVIDETGSATPPESRSDRRKRPASMPL